MVFICCGCEIQLPSQSCPTENRPSVVSYCTIVRTTAGDARVIWCTFSGHHPQESCEPGGVKHRDLFTCNKIRWSCFVSQPFSSMSEDDGLLLNLSSHSDGPGEIYQRKGERKSKVSAFIMMPGSRFDTRPCGHWKELEMKWQGMQKRMCRWLNPGFKCVLKSTG